MAELTIVTQMGDKELRVEHITLKEMLQICAWTSYKNKSEWLQGLQNDEPVALQSAYALAAWRDVGEKPRLGEIDFDMDTLNSKLVDETGEEVVLVFETNDDGTLKLDEDKKPILTLDERGRPQLRYAVSGELLPPTEATPSTTSPTPRKRGSSSASPS